MLSRKNQESAPNYFPLEWQQKVEMLLFEIYQAHCKNENSGFQVHGLTYPDEVFLAVSFVNLKSPTASPYTFLISADLDKQNDPIKMMDTLVDSVGMFFDQFFDDDSREINPVWAEAEYQKRKIFYRTSRENISLTIEADRILNENS